MTKETIALQIAKIVGPENCLTDLAECLLYTYDNNQRHDSPPKLVVFPRTEAHIQAIVRLCFESHTALTCRGRGTGTVGGSVAVMGGIIMSLERMDRIKQIDAANRLAIVEPGVTNEALQNAAAAEGLMWAPDPTSAAYCTIGGNLAYGSAGPRAVKYGTVRENTLGLVAILGDGTRLKTGTKTTKSVVGYDFTRLLIGSEGTLGVICEATLKLLPLPACKRTLRLEYATLKHATDAIVAIMQQPVVPCALEFIDEASINMIRNYTAVSCHQKTAVLLLVELDGLPDTIDKEVVRIQYVANNAGLVAQAVARTKQEASALWAMRKALSPALRHIAPKKINEDVVVPVSRIPELIDGITRICQQYTVKNANFGHAGNGNIHVNLLIDPDNKDESMRAMRCLDEIFTLVLQLEGSISGEHGIGTAKQAYISRELDTPYIQLMKCIKQQFDPRHILNPNKIWPQ